MENELFTFYGSEVKFQSILFKKFTSPITSCFDEKG